MGKRRYSTIGNLIGYFLCALNAFLVIAPILGYWKSNPWFHAAQTLVVFGIFYIRGRHDEILSDLKKMDRSIEQFESGRYKALVPSITDSVTRIENGNIRYL